MKVMPVFIRARLFMVKLMSSIVLSLSDFQRIETGKPDHHILLVLIVLGSFHIAITVDSISPKTINPPKANEGHVHGGARAPPAQFMVN